METAAARGVDQRTGTDAGDVGTYPRRAQAPLPAPPAPPDWTLNVDEPPDPLAALGSTMNLDGPRLPSLPSLNATLQGEISSAPSASSQDLGGTLNLESAAPAPNSSPDVTFQD